MYNKHRILTSTIFVSFFLTSKIVCQLSSIQLAEQNLVTKLFKNYSRTTRPSVQVKIAVNLQLKQIISLVEKTQILTTSSFIEQYWNDPRLTWSPNSTSGIHNVQLSLKSIWLPDTNIINSASGDGYLTINSDFGYVSVLYTGDVYFSSPTIALSTRCALDVASFPFDAQTCNLKITSWSYDDSQIFYSDSFYFKI